MRGVKTFSVLLLIVFLTSVIAPVVNANAENSENKVEYEKGNTELIKEGSVPEQKPQHDLLEERKTSDEDRYMLWYEHPEDRFFENPYLHNREKFGFEDEPIPYHPEKYQEQSEFTPAPAPKDLSKYPSHDPIYIDGNDDFIVGQNGVVSGSGTAADPYIIENWDINAGSAIGIRIENTNVYFIVRNCIIHDGWTGYWETSHCGIYFWGITNGKIDSVTSYNNCEYGVYLYSSSNNTVTNCSLYNNCLGIYLDSSSNNTITNCNVYNNTYNGVWLFYFSNNNIITNCAVYNSRDHGIWLISSSNNIITNCTVYNNTWGIELYSSSNNNQIINCTVYNIYYDGIRLDESSNNKLRNNVLNNNAYNFGVSGYSISDYEQDIDTSNTINGKPIYYIMSQNGLVFNNTMSIGFLGLVSCANIKVENLTLTNNIQGLLLANTSYSTITNCTVYNNSVYGIPQISSSNNNLTNCAVYNNSYLGIWLSSFSNNNIITNCDVYNNYYWGIWLSSSSNNQITNCTVYNNTWGIELYSYSSNNNITNCTIYNNSKGIWLCWSSNDNQITNCTISNSGAYDIYLVTSSSATTINTTFTKTNVYFNDAASTLTVKYYLHVKVINSTGNPITGATVRVRDNANGTLDQNYTTGGDGWVRWIECIEYWQNQTSTIYYTPHNVTANKTGYVTNYTEPNMDSSKEVTITLSVNNPPNQATLISPTNNTWTNNNTLYFDWDFSDPDTGDTQGGFHVQIDNASDFSSPNYEYNDTTSSNTFWQFPEGTSYTNISDGTWYWRVKTKDYSGAWGDWSDIWVVKIDTAEPSSVVDIISPYWQASVPFTVNATASDNTGSGVAYVWLYYRYSSNNLSWGNWTAFGNATSVPWTWAFTAPNGDGYYEFYSIATDNASNTEDVPDVADAAAGLITGAPSDLSISINNGAGHTNSTTVILTLFAVDAIEMQFSNGGTTWSSWEPYNEMKVWDLTLYGGNGNDGIKIVYFKCRNAAGTAGPLTDTIILDRTAPTTTLTIGNPKYGAEPTYVNRTTPFSLSPTDGTGSGVTVTWYTINSVYFVGTLFTLNGYADGEYTITCGSVDAVGNNETGNSITVYVDNTPPAITNIQVSPPTHSTATINWTTDEISDSLIEYGVTTSYGYTKYNATMVTSHSIQLMGLLANTTYHYRITSKDVLGNTKISSDYTFTTAPLPNNPPYTPSNPSPATGATGQSINVDLSWTGGDPDSGDTVTYYVYFGTASDPPYYGTTTSMSYVLPILNYNTHYYWKIVANDSYGVSTSGPVWDFTTESNPSPNTPSTPSGTTSGYTGTTYTYYTSATDPNNDQIKYIFDWDDGTTSETGYTSSGSTGSASHSWNSVDTYYVKVRAYDGKEYSDWSNSLTVTISKANQPPVCIIGNPSPDSYIGGSTAYPTFPVSGSASDSDGDSVSAYVKIDNGEWQLVGGPTQWSCYWEYQWNIIQYSNSQHIIYAKAYDEHCYSEVVSVTCNVQNSISNYVPSCSISSPASGATVSGTTTISGSASDTDGIHSVYVKIDSCDWLKASGTTSWSYSWDTKKVSDGSHTIYAKSYDNKLAVSAIYSISVTVKNAVEVQKLKVYVYAESTTDKIIKQYIYDNLPTTWDKTTSVTDANVIITVGGPGANSITKILNDKITMSQLDWGWDSTNGKIKVYSNYGEGYETYSGVVGTVPSSKTASTSLGLGSFTGKKFVVVFGKDIAGTIMATRAFMNNPGLYIDGNSVIYCESLPVYTQYIALSLFYSQENAIKEVLSGNPSDTDCDGLSDTHETSGTYWTLKHVWDTDNDWMADGWEENNNLNPTYNGDGATDLDGDKLLNRGEYYYSTDPRKEDTDGDGISDTIELYLKMDPCVQNNYGFDSTFLAQNKKLLLNIGASGWAGFILTGNAEYDVYLDLYDMLRLTEDGRNNRITYMITCGGGLGVGVGGAAEAHVQLISMPVENWDEEVDFPITMTGQVDVALGPIEASISGDLHRGTISASISAWVVRASVSSDGSLAIGVSVGGGGGLGIQASWTLSASVLSGKIDYSWLVSAVEAWAMIIYSQVIENFSLIDQYTKTFLQSNAYYLEGVS